MGTCQSASDDTILPKLSSASIENKFKTIVKSVFILPLALNTKLETYSSSGKITDYITKNQVPIEDAYQVFKVENSLDAEGKFIDKVFMPIQSSIGSEPYPQKIQWKRASAFIGPDVKIFEGKIEPSDIKQGRLGDCYLLSSLAAISEYPFIIRRIFETTEISAYGYYGVWLFVDGIWQCVLIDDNFPVNNNKPFFSRNHDGQIWVMLIEKAYAKLFGSYQAISSGLAGIAMNSITAAPYEYLTKDSKSPIDPEVAWNFVTTNIAQNYLMVGSSENNDRNGYIGLVSMHAYSILEVQEVHIAAKKGTTKERILKLENPWGKYEWKGRWSEYSDVWSEELRHQLGFEKANDGIFWINIEDFVQNFGQICACKYNKNYISTSLPLNFPDNDNDYKGVFIRTSNRTEGYLSLIQRDHRFYSKLYEYSLSRVIVLRIDKNSGNLTQYINDFIDCDRDGTMKLQLDPGDYYVIIEIDWKCKFTRTATLCFYGQHPVGMVQDVNPLDMEKLFNEVVLLHEKYTDEQRIYKYAKDDKIMRTTGTVAGYVYYHYSNRSTINNYLCETVGLKEKKFIGVVGEKDPDQFTVKVFPEEERIVRLKVSKEGNSFYSFSTKIQFYVVEKYSLEKLKELADKKPTKIKKREIEGKEIDVRVKTYNYSGGVVLLYQNKMDKYAYLEEIEFELENLELENEELPNNRKLELELEPQAEKLLSFVVKSPGKEIIFRTKMSFYLNAPQFKF